MHTSGRSITVQGRKLVTWLLQGTVRVPCNNLRICWAAQPTSAFLHLPSLQVTHLFRDALHGWGQVVLSVNVSPCAKDYDETTHVLKVGSSAGCW